MKTERSNEEAMVRHLEKSGHYRVLRKLVPRAVVGTPRPGFPREVVELYRDICETAPDGLASLLILRKAPPAPFLPSEVHGQPVDRRLLCGKAGERQEGHAATKDRRATARRHDRAEAFLRPSEAARRRATEGPALLLKSNYLDEFSRDLPDLLLAAAEGLTSPHSSIVVMHLGGAMGRVGEDESAVSHRNARYVVNLAASWEHTPDEPHIAWARKAFTALEPLSLGAGYLNFLTADELAAGDARVRAAYGDDKYARLSALKAKWDPVNLFRHNQNIRPAVRSEMRNGRGRQAWRSVSEIAFPQRS